MADIRLSPEEIARTVAALVAAGFNISHAAQALGIDRTSLQGRIRMIRCRQPDLIPSDDEIRRRREALRHALPPADAAAPAAAPAVAPPADGMALHRARKDRAEAIQTAALLRDQLMALETKLDTVLSLKRADVPDLVWPDRAPAVHSQTVLMPCILMSDFQTGEVIRPGGLEGMNAYNIEIFHDRYQATIEKSIEWADHHVGRAEFPGFMYWQLGDVISGGLHDDLVETDDLPSIPACREVFRAEREGIRQLRARFGRVHVVRINGNHDRTTPKNRSKNQSGLSFGTLLSWWLQTAFEDDPNVTFHVPASPDALVRVFGFNVLLSHGDRMGGGGGTGYIGTEAAILRGHHKLHQNWGRSGTMIDLICTGHYHTAVRTVLGYGNGTMAGYSEYALGLRAIPAAASQQLLFMHEKHKVAHDPVLWLSERPRRTMLDYEA